MIFNNCTSISSSCRKNEMHSVEIALFFFLYEGILKIECAVKLESQASSNGPAYLRPTLAVNGPQCKISLKSLEFPPHG